jgi:hypothetical protein
MKFARLLFLIAGIWGLLVITPLYFLFNTIGRQDPPPITHPGFYYGFIGAALAWQLAFFVIAKDPVRFRPMMIPSVVEKFTYATAGLILFRQARMHSSDMLFVAVDFLFGLLFLIAFLRTASVQTRTKTAAAN